jgi:hypothetical protein
MPPGDIAPVMLGMVLMVTTGLVLILRPISKRLGLFLEAMAEERKRVHAPQPAMDRLDTERMLSAMENLDRRLSRIEERQEFTEALLHRAEPGNLTAGKH